MLVLMLILVPMLVLVLALALVLDAAEATAIGTDAFSNQRRPSTTAAAAHG